MKQKSVTQMLKRRLCMGLSVTMALTLMPATGLRAEGTSLMQAGSAGMTDGAPAVGQPFEAGTGGSRYFDSPALTVRQIVKNANNDEPSEATPPNGVTYMHNDLLIAAAEAQYNASNSEGGQDIIASVSSDLGETWAYSFPFKFEDSAGNADGAVAVSNPVLLDKETVYQGDVTSGFGFVTGGTIYCFANVFPGSSVTSGHAEPKAGSGYINIGSADAADWRLALTDVKDGENTKPAADDKAGYKYYVGDFEEISGKRLAKIKDRSGNAAADSDYAVDEWYNLYQKNGGSYEAMKQAQVDGSKEVQQNVFYKDSALRVYNASYIMCVTSTDNGNSWSVPSVLNPDVFRTAEDEILYLASGKGLHTSQGRLVVPVYSRTDADDQTTSKAGMIFKCLTESHSWHRATDVPALPENEEFDADWAEGGELAELSNGHLRMFLRTGRTNVFYADASRNDETDFFEFSAPVRTQIGATADSKISALEYSKMVNGERAIMTIGPTSAGYTNGYLLTLERGSAENDPLRIADQYEAVEGNIASACMDEMNYGSNLALLYKDNAGSINFKNIYTLDATPNSFIPNLEYDVTLYLDEEGSSYQREYTVKGNYLQQDDPTDESGSVEIAFHRGAAVTEQTPALYRHPESMDNLQEGGADPSQHRANNPRTLTEAYSKDGKPYLDVSADITDAEFTIKQASALEDNLYSVYSEKMQRYFTDHRAASKNFSTTLRNRIAIEPVEGAGTFRIYKPASEPGQRAQRNLIYNNNNSKVMNTNGGGVTTFYLLEKREDSDNEGEENDLVPGYKTVSEITSGKKYLIAGKIAGETEEGALFPAGDDNKQYVIILYPQNDYAGSDRMVGDMHEVTRDAVKTLQFKPVKAGTTDVTVNSITYHITVTTRKTTIPKDGKIFIETSREPQTVSSSNENAVSAEKGTIERDALFNYDASAASKYSDTANWNIDMGGAEFTITGTPEEGYEIYSEFTRQYLVNAKAASVFASSSAKMDLDFGDRASSMIKSKTGRYFFFHYPGVNFNSADKIDPSPSYGDYYLEFLEKQDIVSNTDDIPGYARVDKITSGKKYLITNFYTDSAGKDMIVILYPTNGIANQSKKFQAVPFPGVWVTAKGDAGDEATIQIDNESRLFVIGAACDHEGYAYRIENKKEATCTEDGYTGDKICTNCQVVFEKGTVDPAGHDYGDDDEGWVLDETRMPAYDPETHTATDGYLVRPCKRDASHPKQEKAYSGESFVSGEIDTELAKVNTLNGNKDTYAKETQDALAAAIAQAGSADTLEKKIDALEALKNVQKNLVTAAAYNTRKGQLTALISQKQAEAERTSYYTEDSIRALQDKLKELTDGAVNAMTYAELDEARNALNGVTLVKSEAAEACEALQAQLEAECANVASIIEAGNDDKKYTEESWNTLKTAYDAVNGKTIDELIALGADKLAGYLADLKKELVQTQPGGSNQGTNQGGVNQGGTNQGGINQGGAGTGALSAGVPYPVGGVTYQVSGNPANNEIIITKGNNARNVKIKATETINGVQCKVVGIGNNAFKGMSKVRKVIIGDNVRTIGKNAFANCKKLTAVTLGKNVKTINAKAFFGCKKLKTLTLKGKNAVSIKKQAFKNTAKKSKVKWPKGIKKGTKNKLKKNLRKQGFKVK